MTFNLGLFALLLTRTLSNNFVSRYFFVKVDTESQHRKTHLGLGPKPTENLFPTKHLCLSSVSSFFFSHSCSIFVLTYYSSLGTLKKKLASFLFLFFLRSSCPPSPESGRMYLKAKTLREWCAGSPQQQSDPRSFNYTLLKLPEGRECRPSSCPS